MSVSRELKRQVRRYEPCLPRPAKEPPAGPGWIHEVKHAGILFNRHFDVEGAIVYRHACALGCEGIVSKRLGSPYRPGRQDCWIKFKNPDAPAVRRLKEEDKL